MKHQAPKGTHDLLPGVIERWQWAEDRARAVCERYGYREIRTPMFEDYELFARTSGESSDVVQKEMYRFQDLGERDLALRPEGTAGVARAYLEHKLSGQGRVHRLWYTGPMFRYSRPQKGRYRQFSQIGAEVIGTPAPAADVEIVALFVDIFEAWGFRDLVVMLNSVGSPDSRRAYGEAIRRWLEPVTLLLSADSRQRLTVNPMRVLDSKDPRDQMLLRGEWRQAWSAMRNAGDPVVTDTNPGGTAALPLASVEIDVLPAAPKPSEPPPAPSQPFPRMLDVLDDDSSAHFDAVRHGLETLGIRYEIDHGLVRGLDYYTRTAFEVHDRSLGAQSALGGGGRYDGLIEALGGPSTPGVGFSIGLDRALLALEERGAATGTSPASVFVVAMDVTRDAAARLLRDLRRTVTATADLDGKAFGAQMKAAGKSGARWLVLVGEDEWAREEVVVKDLTSGEQETVKATDVVERLRGRISSGA